MTSIKDIREATHDISDEDVRASCLHVIDEVERRIAQNRLGNWTFSTFAKWLGRSNIDLTVQQCVQLLVSKEKMRLLDMHFYFIDRLDQEGGGEPIADSEVRAAIESGYLIDPHSGAEIHEYEDQLVPYFVPHEGLAL